MSYRFRPYVGKKKHAFVSYSRGDFSYVLDVIYILYEKKYRLWYDEGIPAGDDWPAYIADNLKASASVIFFASAKAFASPNCYSEIKTAAGSGKSIICITLDDSASIISNAVNQGRELNENETAFLKEQINLYAGKRKSNVKIPEAGQWHQTLQSAAFIEYDEDCASVGDKILSKGIIDDKYIGSYGKGIKVKKHINGWMIAIIMSLLLLGATSYLAYDLKNQADADTEPSEIEQQSEEEKTDLDASMFEGIVNTDISFPDEVQESAIRSVIGKNDKNISVQRADLKGVTSLHICGNLAVSDKQRMQMKEGKWYVGNSLVNKGEISDLSIIGTSYMLQDLSLVYQNIESIDQLVNLNYLKTLDISSNPISSLDNIAAGSLKQEDTAAQANIGSVIMQVISDSDGSSDDSFFQSLEEINISHTNIRDLEPLSKITSLKRVYVSSDMVPLNFGSGTFEVVLVK